MEQIQLENLYSTVRAKWCRNAALKAISGEMATASRNDRKEIDVLKASREEYIGFAKKGQNVAKELTGVDEQIGEKRKSVKDTEFPFREKMKPIRKVFSYLKRQELETVEKIGGKVKPDYKVSQSELKKATPEKKKVSKKPKKVKVAEAPVEAPIIA